VHITGLAKRDPLELDWQSIPVSSLPVRLTLHQDKVPCQIFSAPYT
jgi:hypothetical protein